MDTWSLVSANQITEAAGISRKTLSRWEARGVIPAPVYRTSPSGHGRLAYWDGWVLERCRRIARLQAEGHSLGEAVAAIERPNLEGSASPDAFAGDESHPQQDPGVDRGAFQAPELDALVRAGVIAAAERLLGKAGVPNRLRRLISKTDLTLESVRYLFSAENPVVVFTGTDLSVVPDYLVSQRLSRLAGQTVAPLVVIPLFPAYSRAREILRQGTPQEPVIGPAPKIRIHRPTDVAEMTYRYSQGRYEAQPDTLVVIERLGAERGPAEPDSRRVPPETASQPGHAPRLVQAKGRKGKRQ